MVNANISMVLAATPSPPPHSISPTNTTHPLNNHSRLLHHLNKCTSMSHLKQIHAHTLRTTSPQHPHTLFLNSRIFHFSTLHDLNYAFRLFTLIQNPNSFIWNTLIRGCARTNDQKEQAILLYNTMLNESNVDPDKHTFPFVLKACAYLFGLSQGEQLHAHIFKLGLEKDVFINNSLIHLYSSCGCLEKARDVFEEMPERSVVSWNVMIDGLVLLGEFDEALKMFREMQMLFEPDGYSIQSVLRACAGLGALSMGMWAHAYVLKKCASEMGSDVLVNNCIVDMYCKCGSLGIAIQVFEKMVKRDVTSWNSMILGFAMHGEVEGALDYFTRMVHKEGMIPNSITFSGVLSACNHGGLVNVGRKYFDRMINDYKIQPVLEHYGCLIDLLARAGLINEALDLVLNMPMKPDAVIWRSLLDACCKKNVGVGLSEEVARQAIELEGSFSSGAYVLLSRVYAAASQWKEVGLVRKLMTDKGVIKEPGCSLIEINGVTHEFFAGDTSHPRSEEIYQYLNVIEKRLVSSGYVADVSQATMVDEHNDGKQLSLRLHSEKLAIAFGLISLEPGVPIRIFKNLRVCNDCHNATKWISKIYNVDIIVRDRARFHHIRDGACSCMDYW